MYPINSAFISPVTTYISDIGGMLSNTRDFMTPYEYTEPKAQEPREAVP